MGRFYFEIKHDKVDFKQMKRDYHYLFGNRILIDVLNLLVISALLWGGFAIAKIYWSDVAKGALVITLAILGMAWTLIFLYKLLIPFIVRILIPIIINSFNLIIFPFALIQIVLDKISNLIINSDFLDNTHG
ncbi:MAG: hypothetical protein WCK34_02085 [Bacteroidota bacterium]